MLWFFYPTSILWMKQSRACGQREPWPAQSRAGAGTTHTELGAAGLWYRSSHVACTQRHAVWGPVGPTWAQIPQLPAAWTWASHLTAQHCTNFVGSPPWWKAISYTKGPCMTSPAWPWRTLLMSLSALREFIPVCTLSLTSAACLSKIEKMSHLWVLSHSHNLFLSGGWINLCAQHYINDISFMVLLVSSWGNHCLSHDHEDILLFSSKSWLDFLFTFKPAIPLELVFSNIIVHINLVFK